MSDKSVLRALEDAIRSIGFHGNAESVDDLGERLRALRFRLNITQEAFAKRFGIPLANIRNWESCPQGTRPDYAACLLLKMIELDADSIAWVVATADDDRLIRKASA
jgi:DNA-binding transcriptional regulator YiaG